MGTGMNWSRWQVFGSLNMLMITWSRCLVNQTSLLKAMSIFVEKIYLLVAVSSGDGLCLYHEWLIVCVQEWNFRDSVSLVRSLWNSWVCVSRQMLRSLCDSLVCVTWQMLRSLRDPTDVAEFAWLLSLCDSSKMEKFVWLLSLQDSKGQAQKAWCGQWKPVISWGVVFSEWQTMNELICFRNFESEWSKL